MRTPRQPVSDKTGAAPVTPSGGTETPTEQPMEETGTGMDVTVPMEQMLRLWATQYKEQLI